MLHLISKGGILMYPIILMSVISFAIFFERLYSLRMKRYFKRKSYEKLISLIDAKNLDEALNLCNKENSPFSRVVSRVIKTNRDEITKKEDLLSLAQDYTDEELYSINKYQDMIATIVTLAPLLGLLGTILGMIRIFGALSESGAGNAQALSGGIAEALLTTAAGLLTAIPAQIFYQIISYKADRIYDKLISQISNVAKAIFKGNL